MRVRRGSSRSASAPAPGAARGPARPPAAGTRRGAHAGPPAEEFLPEDGHPGPRRTGLARLRPRTVRARILALLMVPVISVLALWSFASVTTAQSVWDRTRLLEVRTGLLTPLSEAVAGLQAERAAAGRLLAAPGATRESVLREAAAGTDAAAARLTFGPAYNRADALGLGTEAATRLDALGASVAGLPDLRTRVLARTVGWTEAYAAYGSAVDQAFEVAGAVSRLQQDGADASDARVLLDLARSRELLAREDALLRAGQSAGTLPEDQLREFSGAVFARRQFERGPVADLRPADRAALLAVLAGPDSKDLTGYEEKVRGAPDGRAAVAAVDPDRWSVAADGVARALRTVDGDADRAAGERLDPYAFGLFGSSGLAVLLGLVAVIASLLISVQIGRGLVTELVGLRNSALELAGRGLPATMRRLRAGEEIDIATEAPLPPHGSDEIGQVHGALGSVRRAAVTAAVERAEVLSGVSGVFVNLARRSQVLVHRQLTLLDAMERRTDDPAELDDLFRLDHLTTRMRRHAEGLIILSGAVPGRAWRRPVPLLDVVRAAVAEVEEYARVEVHRLPFAALAGPAVADLTHLVAELVENATGFSPPHTKVHVRGERVGNGYALEIEDRGLGMGAEALADANRRIAAAEQSDLFDSDRLGLFVVSRLARRQNVRVSLRPSAYGGTTAVVLLPTALLEERAEDGLPAHRPATGGHPAHDRTRRRDPAPGHAPEPAGGHAPGGRTPGGARPGRPAPLRPFGALGDDPGMLRPSPFRADGARAEVPPPAAPAAAGPAAPAALHRAGPAQPDRRRPAPAVPPGSPPAARPPADGAVRPPAPTPSSGPEPEDGDELPRRVRQASLAPQLREAPARPRRAAAGRAGAAGSSGRNPEEARAAMSALQQGWARGRGPERPATPDRPSPRGEIR
ncbi:nitrate- and nitrite sensing domain-containing protein [Kitasatospora sp. NBC_00240]|uniref:sensor histidine kinase n=1 Tax=Kitasatospora sp. NBC_00240 TaxID=2903567 RepID=UPI002258D850|nr:nitrate- and nitrite sensing domain-containing protein [Kitasatospora sp. NBC_00240]MCX5209627.1 nitrate- and nitrite sensing domain-containing protein [Kitasatospora sp. NBC_00240]